MPASVLFRNKSGRFVSYQNRYKLATRVQIRRRGKYLDAIVKEKITPKSLANVTTRDEYESLGEALTDLGEYKSSKVKYKAWDVSEQIDKTKGIRGKLLKITLNLDDGGIKRSVSFYHHMRKRSPMSKTIWYRMNEALGIIGYYLYDRVGGKLLSDRKGKQVKLTSTQVDEVT